MTHAVPPRPHGGQLPQAPGQFPHPPAQFPPGWPAARRKPQAMVLPVIVIVLGGLIGAGFVLLVGAGAGSEGHLVTWLIGVLFSMVTATGGIIYLHWLDRWEPEPPHLLVAAFFWGGGVALLLALVFGAPFSGLSDYAQATFGAPLTEETAKALFFVVVLLTTRRGRAELNSLTDALVYAGFIGIGFSFVEDMAYIAQMPDATGAWQVVVLRGLGAFSHSIYTAMTAIGIWKGMNSRGAMRIVWPLLGLCVAMLLHGIHNGSTAFGLVGVLGAMLVFGLGGFVFYLVVGLRSRRREGRVVAAQLHPMVAQGWVTPPQAAWLSTMTGRRARLGTASPADRRRLRGFRDDATELAFVRDRLDAEIARGEAPSPALLAQHDQLVDLLRSSQGWVEGQLPPAPGAWPPAGPPAMR